MAIAKLPVTEEEFMRLPDDGNKYELVGGEIKLVSPANFEHDALVIRLGVLLHPYARRRGYLTGSQAGFRMRKGNFRSPDLGFTRKERLPGRKPVRTFADFAPDLCIEIISPSEERAEMMRKVEEYFQSGAQQVWHLFPQSVRLDLYTSPAQVKSLGAEDELEGGDLLPGFRCRVEELFDFDEDDE